MCASESDPISGAKVDDAPVRVYLSVTDGSAEAIHCPRRVTYGLTSVSFVVADMPIRQRLKHVTGELGRGWER